MIGQNSIENTNEKFYSSGFEMGVNSLLSCHLRLLSFMNRNKVLRFLLLHSNDHIFMLEANKMKIVLSAALGIFRNHLSNFSSSMALTNNVQCGKHKMMQSNKFTGNLIRNLCAQGLKLMLVLLSTSEPFSRRQRQRQNSGDCFPFEYFLLD